MAQIVHWEIMGPDGEQLAGFYRDLFGWTLQAPPGMDGYLMADEAQTGIGGAVGTGNENMPNYVTVYVQVESIDETLAQAEAAGAKTLVPKTTIPDMVTFAIFSDPAGNPTGLVEGD